MASLRNRHAYGLNLILTIGLGLLIYGCQTDIPQAKNEKLSSIISIGIEDSIQSKILNEKRKIWVRLPKNAGLEKKKYPVVYLLDGDIHFHSFTGIVSQLSENGINILPEMVVIGILNTDRTRDLTPTHVDVVNGDSAWVKTSGGNDKFLNFLEKELIPYVKNKYPVCDYETLVGHSFGGLAVLNALIKKPYLFDNYLALDPSLWWDNMEFLKRADSLLSTYKSSEHSLYMALANTMNREIDLNTILQDSSETSQHIRSELTLVKSLQSNGNKKLRFNWQYFGNENHLSVPLIGSYEGLRYLFDWYEFKGMEKILNPKTTALESEKLIIAHYYGISNRLGYVVYPPINHINEIGFYLLSENLLKKAYTVLRMNILSFPKSAKAHDTMGDFYVAISDTTNAISYFSKALKLEENTQTRKKLDKLKENS